VVDPYPGDAVQYSVDRFDFPGGQQFRIGTIHQYRFPGGDRRYQLGIALCFYLDYTACDYGNDAASTGTSNPRATAGAYGGAIAGACWSCRGKIEPVLLIREKREECTEVHSSLFSLMESLVYILV